MADKEPNNVSSMVKKEEVDDSMPVGEVMLSGRVKKEEVEDQKPFSVSCEVKKEEASDGGAKTDGRKGKNIVKEENDTTFSLATKRKDTPIWFKLVATNQGTTNAPLAQISAGFIRVKNNTDTLTLSYVKKYIVMKLNLASEYEVELYLDDEPLDSSMVLYDLLQYWIGKKAAAGETVNPEAGSSGEDYVMVINYGRKPRHVA